MSMATITVKWRPPPPAGAHRRRQMTNSSTRLSADQGSKGSHWTHLFGVCCRARTNIWACSLLGGVPLCPCMFLMSLRMITSHNSQNYASKIDIKKSKQSIMLYNRKTRSMSTKVFINTVPSKTRRQNRSRNKCPILLPTNQSTAIPNSHSKCPKRKYNQIDSPLNLIIKRTPPSSFLTLNLLPQKSTAL